MQDLEDMTEADVMRYLCESKVIRAKDSEWYKRPIDASVECNKAIYFLPRSSLFRKICYNLQKHRNFENFIMFLIAASSLKLATDTYTRKLEEDHIVQKISVTVDIVFTWLFLGECVIKVISLGFAQDDGSYLRDNWNQLDFLIVLTSMIDFTFSSVNLPFVKILRILRALRPLRVISHSQSLRLIVSALLKSTGAIINVAVCVFLVWMMFAIIGLNTYSGKFFYCSLEKYYYHT